MCFRRHKLPAAILLLTGTGVSIHHLLLPYVYLCLFMFTIGMGFILATLAVFLRDMFYIYGVLISLWTYLTPIMYDLAIIEDPTLLVLLKLNPMYWFIYFARRIMLYHIVPEPNSWIYCMLLGLGTLIIGIVVFRKNQDKFIYYA